MTASLEKYREQFQRLKKDPSYRFGVAQEFVSTLLSLPPENRFELLPLLEEIEQEAFENGYVIPNLDIASLKTDKDKWDATRSKHVARARPEELSKTDLNGLLVRLSSENSQFFGAVKGCFIFRLENVEQERSRLVIVHDEDFKQHPALELIGLRCGEYEIDRYRIQEFADLLENDASQRNQNYLCIFLINSNLRNDEMVVPDILKIIELFQNKTFVSIARIPILTAADYTLENVQSGLASINNSCSKVLNNRALSFQEEVIIKKFFGGTQIILDYKFLKEGSSGSRIVELQPSKVKNPKMARFVVKFSPRMFPSKLAKEHEVFREFFDDLDVPGYQAAYECTASQEAIRYKYASSDSTKDSFPFSQLVDASMNGNYNFGFKLETVIDEVFACDPFRKWNSATSDENRLVKTFYSDYLNSEGRVLDTVSMIKGVEREEAERENLIANYRRIKEYPLRTKEKICHGDLHSENFFKDEKGVYLIDFGWTGRRHAVIDHATLECSLKFRHLPFYVPVDDLIRYEKSLLSSKSFEPMFDLSFVNRKDLRQIYSLILKIRSKSKEFTVDKLSPMEYLVSLFIMTFRQIQYRDLNQQYAMRSAEVIGEAIARAVATGRWSD